MVLFSSVSEDNIGSWKVINDGVMGGLSEGKIMYDDQGLLTFSGKVSLENNGGFSSMSYPMNPTDITGKTFFVLEVKGDGNRYQFRAKKNQSDYYSYVNYFDTTGEWETIKIPIESLTPSFRGRKLDMDHFSAVQLSEIGILIGNKKAQKFEIKISSIKLQ